ncbi:hypothetical protein HYH03_018081 [Edaphochlamys debaryana]|uniref:Protein kinase domain-containing protein n=1 Tax=Edaphochlamys debaryana TaxID=47281 RepID=A0A835XH84_9CHLO|nr:hypothetical protein HYH03_018081 [Edaphochlamys debaryana]|eukprot:KAG2483052.1 hypothetical protein HYH03_018081 [Edaphochlamys debaryana]
MRQLDNKEEGGFRPQRMSQGMVPVEPRTSCSSAGRSGADKAGGGACSSGRLLPPGRMSGSGLPSTASPPNAPAPAKPRRALASFLRSMAATPLGRVLSGGGEKSQAVEVQAEGQAEATLERSPLSPRMLLKSPTSPAQRTRAPWAAESLATPFANAVTAGHVAAPPSPRSQAAAPSTPVAAAQALAAAGSSAGSSSCCGSSGGSSASSSSHALTTASQAASPSTGASAKGSGGSASGLSKSTQLGEELALTPSSPARRGVSPRPVPPPFVALTRPTQDGPVAVWSNVPATMHRRMWCRDDYHVSRNIYKGYASEVFKAVCLKSGRDVVLKAYSLSSLSSFLTHQALREVSIHSRLEHPSIVQFLGAFKEGDFLVLVLEYVAGGSLDRARRKLGGRLSEAQAQQLVMLPLLRALAHLHARGVVHRDIKPENLLFTPEWQLKVCDMGVSVCLAEERAVTRTGSKDYMAPEVTLCPLKRTPADNKDSEAMAYTPAVDVWSLGVVAYELLTGFTPFQGGPPAPSRPAPSLVFPGSVSPAARDFVMSCLAMRPEERPTVQQLLRHGWMAAAVAEASKPRA